MVNCQKKKRYLTEIEKNNCIIRHPYKELYKELIKNLRPSTASKNLKNARQGGIGGIDISDCTSVPMSKCRWDPYYCACYCIDDRCSYHKVPCFFSWTCMFDAATRGCG